MAEATITLILDRLHSINGSLSGITSKRYFPQNIGTDAAAWPLVTVVPSAAQHTYPSVSRRMTQRDFLLFALVGNFMGGLPTQTAIANAETVIETILSGYEIRPQLQYNDTGLANIERVRIVSDTGLIPEGDGLATVTFTLRIWLDKMTQEEL